MKPLDENELQLQLAQAWGIKGRESSAAEFEAQLAARINQLISEDFNKLISILYRLDIDELALRKLLQKNENDAGTIIAGMVIQRQMEKNKSSREFRQRDDNIDETEKL